MCGVPGQQHQGYPDFSLLLVMAFENVPGVSQTVVCYCEYFSKHYVTISFSYGATAQIGPWPRHFLWFLNHTQLDTR
jgi:hypothetical protein